MNAKSEVLIIGAGPVGLCMGLALAKQGVSFRIIDSAAAPVKESRAIGIQARTLEIFEMMGMVNEFLDVGHQLHGVTIYGQSGAKIAHLDMQKLPSRYHFVLTLRQSETERILSDQLHKLGLQVERQTTLLSFEQSGIEVQASISLPNGARERVRTDWLIGCDGAHSRVREIMNLKFIGKVYDLQFLLGDFHVISDLSDDAAHVFARKEGLFALFPLGKGRCSLDICRSSPVTLFRGN